MTFCKELARAEHRHGDIVTAWELWEKNSRIPHYEITIARGGSAFISYGDTIKTAKTTWRKKFKEVLRDD